ncbi:MAG: transcriptional repressor [Eubacterium sp.]|jgi:Fur family ferric uptake transcriptional regulator|nr:transcriptional repressor [Eubacterium sp.]MCI2197908.1 transcriptional repressor [Eubacterium sp.]
MSKSEYKTRQKDAILDYLKQHPGKHVTAGSLQRLLEDKGIHIGTTTIYRTLDRLVAENQVRKYENGSGQSACYEYLNEETRCHPGEYHMMCERCGRLIHLHCEEMKKITDHIQAGHGFILDPGRTVLYGICEECRLLEEEEKKKKEADHHEK